MSIFKSGYVSVVGLPNVGKSSLVNSLVKESVSIVTSKPQTTRKRTLGILTEPGRYQIIFVDTPGVTDSDVGLNSFLKQELSAALRDVDVIIAAIGPWEFESTELPWVLKMYSQYKRPVFFVITQIDKLNIRKENIAAKWSTWIQDHSLAQPLRLHFTSSRSGEGLDGLKEMILGALPFGPQYYDPEIYTTQTMRELTNEVIRKYCFERLFQEIPYGLAVVIRSFEEGPILKIAADIIVSKEGHKGMVVGQGGRSLKEIGIKSRMELEQIFETKVFLKLHVVAKPWLKDRYLLEELGYVAQ